MELIGLVIILPTILAIILLVYLFTHLSRIRNYTHVTAERIKEQTDVLNAIYLELVKLNKKE
jgi:chromate transport protein ChrA